MRNKVKSEIHTKASKEVQKIIESFANNLEGKNKELFTVKITQLSWCAPPNYELLEKSWKDVLYRILEFYTLSGIEMDNMQFVNRWNLLAMISQIVCIGTGFLFFMEMSTKGCDV